MRTRMKKLLVLAPLALVAMALFAFVGGEIVKVLWNWLTPALFGWKPITFWQAFALLVLCRILFGRSGFRRGFRGPGAWRRRHGRWERMSPEERQQLREMFFRRWSGQEPAEPKATS